MISKEQLFRNLEKQIEVFPDAFYQDSPSCFENIEDWKYVNIFHLTPIIDKKDFGKRFHTKIKSDVYCLAGLAFTNDTSEQIRRMLNQIRTLTEISVGRFLKKNKIKKVFGKDRKILFGRFSMQRKGDYITFICDVNFFGSCA